MTPEKGKQNVKKLHDALGKMVGHLGRNSANSATMKHQLMEEMATEQTRLAHLKKQFHAGERSDEFVDEYLGAVERLAHLHTALGDRIAMQDEYKRLLGS